MKKTEAYFIGHCDEEGCDLGTFEYTCPCCGKFTVDYEVWWEEDKIWKGTPHKFDCEKCEANLVVTWDPDEIQYTVTNK